MSSKRYNVAVIGYGLSAKIFNIPFIQPVPELNLYGIVQRHPKPDDDASKDFPGVKTWRSSEEMLEDDQVDVVVVTTIPGSHFELTKAALEKGKHVVVEKPFVPTHKEAEELRKIAERSGKLCTVFQNRVRMLQASLRGEAVARSLARFSSVPRKRAISSTQSLAQAVLRILPVPKLPN